MKKEKLTKRELVELLEGSRIIITNPDEYTVKELNDMLKQK